jgi:hypothetical protein
VEPTASHYTLEEYEAAGGLRVPLLPHLRMILLGKPSPGVAVSPDNIGPSSGRLMYKGTSYHALTARRDSLGAGCL